jgi:CheY-like chemotaxis protein
MTQLILLVDDDALALGVRRLVLEAASYEVLTASSACQALDFVSAQRFDLVITDNTVTRSGQGLADELRCLIPRLPVITLSGGSIPRHEFQPPDYFLHKLDGPEEMLAKVSSAILSSTQT